MMKLLKLKVTLLLALTVQVGYSGSLKVEKKAVYFPVEFVRITSGPFKTAQEKGIEYLLAVEPDRLLAPYYKGAGLKPKAENYTNWENSGLDGHIGGHYLSALAYMYAATGNVAIGQRLDYMLKELKICQDASGNGYLSGIPDGVTMWKDVADGKIRAGGFDLNGKWVPLYNIHKIYAGLKDATVQAHREDAKEMLVKLTDWMITEVSHLSDGQIQQMLVSEHGGLNEVFADVAEITGKDKYLELARKFSHRAILDPLVDGKNELTGKHANTQIPKVIGYKRIADLENNTDWENAVEFFWNDVVNNRSVSIGGNSVREHFHSPDDFSSMLESEQGPETCNTYNMLRLSKLLYETSLGSNYSDYIERALFNHILSSQNPVHGGFVYFTSMRPGHYRVYSQPQTSFWCCVGSGMENQARYGEYIYAHNGKDIFVNLFIPSTLEWNGNKLIQTTDFPESDSSSLELIPAETGKFSLNVRVPEWTQNEKVKVTVNGKEIIPLIENGYVTINRKWKKGDKVIVTLPMDLHLEQLADGTSNYSILYGPIVLAASLGTDEQKGLFADDSRGGHIAEGKKLPLQEMPVIVGNKSDILSYITKVSDRPLEFKLSHVYPEKYDYIDLVPFSSLNECRYIVYWPVIDRNQLEVRQKQIAETQAARMALDAITADVVVCGEQQPESDHFIEMEKSWNGSDHDLHWRRANKEGWFSYIMHTAGENTDSLRIYYKPAKDRSAVIYADGNEIGRLLSADSDKMIYVDFPLKVLKNGECNIKVAAPVDMQSPDIYEIRMIKSDE